MPPEEAAKTHQENPNQVAAHQFLTELRTRISMQPLPYQHGVAERALESLVEVFGHARKAIKEHPGCREFAQETSDALNTILRPLTAKWHPAKERGLLRSRDGGDVFRAELAIVQSQLRAFANGVLGPMAYGKELADAQVPPAIEREEIDEIMAPVAFGMEEDPNRNGGVAQTSAQTFNTKEGEHIRVRREGRSQPDHGSGTNAFGVALSGGGIRSGTFCLGVVQVLAERELLAQADYLSTVSGGGYTGAFATKQLAESDDPKSDLGKPHGPDPESILELRRHAKFLSGGSQWTSAQMLVEGLAGMLFNWFVPLALVAQAAIAAIVFNRWIGPPIRGKVADLRNWLGVEGSSVHFWSILATTAGAMTLVGGLCFFSRARGTKTPSRWTAGWFAVSATILAISFAVWGIQALLSSHFPLPVPTTGQTGPWWKWTELEGTLQTWPIIGRGGMTWLSLGAIGAAIPVLLRFVPIAKNPVIRKGLVFAGLGVAGVLVPLLGVAAFYVLYAIGGGHGDSWMTSGLLWLAVGTAVLVLLLWRLLDINATGPHRLYRRGLSRTFVDDDKSEPRLHHLHTHDENRRAPYHLINTTVNLPRGNVPRLRERKGDFFLFSKHLTGSPTTGYEPTEHWRTGDREPDLATAMAVSGAAFSSNMGLGSIPALRSLLTFLNVRLGYWIKNPSDAATPNLLMQAAGLTNRKRGPNHPDYPGFACLLREMTGIGMREDAQWLNLSDGGHIENMATYELLRRRCKFIVTVDGECDAAHTFPGLRTLIRHAQIDLGVQIRPDLDELRPDENGLCRSHYHLCRIHYPPRENGEPEYGLLLYIKLSLTGNESELIRGYKQAHPSFPHQTTLDQFFDEEQFEAYRQLGVHAAEGLFSPTLMEDETNRPVTTPADWFRRLARNLLMPAPPPQTPPARAPNP